MIKDILKEKEPIAYLSLKNDLNSGRLAHSYLFYGELNPLKLEAAFLLAQSIIEDKGDFACEKCDTCLRIRALKYYDVIYVDGSKELIKKENIDHIMDEFSKTSLESSIKKIYIINNINNASTKVLNMILKFMEEPSSKDVTGILISDNADALLETVVSRCKKVEFKTRDFSAVMEEYKEIGFDETDAYFLCQIKHSTVDIDLNDEAYINAREYVYKTIDNLDNKEYLGMMFFKELYSAVPKELFKDMSSYYLDIMLIMINDAFKGNELNDDYASYLSKLRKCDLGKLLEIFSLAKDRSYLPLNRQLLFDQIVSQIIL